MDWILQENLFREDEWKNLVLTLERFKIGYSVHKVIPFIGELIPAPEKKAGKVVCFGSYSMRHAARAHGWTPGVYDLFDQNFMVQYSHWGALMLNADSSVMTFRDVGMLKEPLFIRPVDDSKYFAGKVFMPQEFNQWHHQLVKLNLDFGNSLTAETLVQVCPPKEILAEYRYWIVGGKIVTRSLYKRGGRVFYSPDVDQRFDDFVRHVLDDWQPHRAFVIDVCDSATGIKIVEINTINAAGFYAADIQKLVMALEEMEGA